MLGSAVLSLLFPDDVFLLASSSYDHQLVLGWFASKCEVPGMRISTSKSEVMALSRKRAAWPQVEHIMVCCSQVKEEGSKKPTDGLVQ